MRARRTRSGDLGFPGQPLNGTTSLTAQHACQALWRLARNISVDENGRDAGASAPSLPRGPRLARGRGSARWRQRAGSGGAADRAACALAARHAGVIWWLLAGAPGP